MASGGDAAHTNQRVIPLGPNMPTPEKPFCDNSIKTSKYTLFPWRLDFFLYKNLYEQFQRISNVYFIFIVILQLIPGLSPTGRYTTLAALTFVLFVSAVKAAYEDFKRHKSDDEINNRPTYVLRNSQWTKVKWREIQVGDFVKLQNEDDIPADIILLSTSEDEGLAYVQTANLDGETNLKAKNAVPETWNLNNESILTSTVGRITCEEPTQDLYTFTGVVTIGQRDLAVGPEQLLLRGSQLRKAAWIMGVSVYTGKQSKVMKNTSRPPFKRSSMEKMVDRLLIVVLVLLVVLVLVSASVITATEVKDYWYLAWNPSKVGLFFISLPTFLILFHNLIPISLYVSMELVRVAQGYMIDNDIQMYYAPKDMPAIARTTTLNEELGQVNYIFSDKTGTLTCNLMKFFKFSCGGMSYGEGITEIGRAAAKRQNKPVEDRRPEEYKTGSFPFWDPRILDGQWKTLKDSALLEDFFTLLAVCHTAVTENDKTGKSKVQAESPDEEALIEAATKMGIQFQRRKAGGIIVISVEGSEQEYVVKNVLAFTSDRKRMSCVVGTPHGQTVLLSKGADNEMLRRLQQQNLYVEETKQHLQNFSEEGLRTLVCAKKEIPNAEYEEWNARFQKARKLLGDERKKNLEELAEEMEWGLTLVGATAIEDRLQDGVPETIAQLRKAGVRVWVLTGDKQETAINIGFACDLLNSDMHLIIINAPDVGQITAQLENALANLGSLMAAGKEVGTVIDGAALKFILPPDPLPGQPAPKPQSGTLDHKFYDLASRCPAVVCCRMSPVQKAKVVTLVRKRDQSSVTLAIGDGANDVNMIQAAHVGIGISGMEGVQAANSADYAIGQFYFLYRLLMVHGRWCYRRTALLICYSFYKNVLLYLSQFYFLFINIWSGQSLYDKWVFALYNITFTSLPILVYGVMDRDLIDTANTARFPRLFEHGLKHIDFSALLFVQWISNGIYHGVVCFVLTFAGMNYLDEGQDFGMDAVGTAVFTGCVIVVNLRLAVDIESWTIVHHIALWGTIIFWFLFMLVYGELDEISPDMYKMMLKLGGVSGFWLCIVIVSIITIFRDYLWKYSGYNLVPLSKMLLYRMVRILEHTKGVLPKSQSKQIQFSAVTGGSSNAPTHTPIHSPAAMALLPTYPVSPEQDRRPSDPIKPPRKIPSLQGFRLGGPNNPTIDPHPITVYPHPYPDADVPSPYYTPLSLSRMHAQPLQVIMGTNRDIGYYNSAPLSPVRAAINPTPYIDSDNDSEPGHHVGGYAGGPTKVWKQPPPTNWQAVSESLYPPNRVPPWAQGPMPRGPAPPRLGAYTTYNGYNPNVPWRAPPPLLQMEYRAYPRASTLPPQYPSHVPPVFYPYPP